jgi:hypothetical protein
MAIGTVGIARDEAASYASGLTISTLADIVCTGHKSWVRSYALLRGWPERRLDISALNPIILQVSDVQTVALSYYDELLL